MPQMTASDDRRPRCGPRICFEGLISVEDASHASSFGDDPQHRRLIAADVVTGRGEVGRGSSRASATRNRRRISTPQRPTAPPFIASTPDSTTRRQLGDSDTPPSFLDLEAPAPISRPFLSWPNRADCHTLQRRPASRCPNPAASQTPHRLHMQSTRAP